MEKKATGKKKATVKASKVEFSNSLKEVKFTASKDHKGMVKGATYLVSENVASILKHKGLGEYK